MYNNNFCISIGVEHVNLYQHFTCQPQIKSCKFVINCTHSNSGDWPYKHVSFDDLFCSRLQATLLLHNKEKTYERTIQTNHNFTCLQLSTLTPKLIQGKSFLAMTSVNNNNKIKMVVFSSGPDLHHVSIAVVSARWIFFTFLELENNNKFQSANAKALHECC